MAARGECDSAQRLVNRCGALAAGLAGNRQHRRGSWSVSERPILGLLRCGAGAEGYRESAEYGTTVEALQAVALTPSWGVPELHVAGFCSTIERAVVGGKAAVRPMAPPVR